jgi:T5SS/PEP-CTERM-associated repeat protein
MSGTTLSGSYLTGVILSDPATQNPATVTGTISVPAGTALQGQAGTAWTVVDQGTISSTAGVGVALASGGSITTTANALIAGSTVGAYIYGATGGITNAGAITASAGPGVHLGLGGTIIDQPGGQITGSAAGILISGGPGTVTAAGTIVGTGTAGEAVVFAPGYANLLVDDPGAVLTGTVDGGNPPGSTIASSTLLLASGTSAGTISGIGSQFVDFAAINVTAGGAWTLTGFNTITSGVALFDGGSLTNAGTLYGTVIGVTLGSGASLTNLATATLTAPSSAIISVSGGAPNTVANYGSIGGIGYVGVGLLSGGTLTNAAGGTISGAYAAVYMGSGAGTVTNAGLLTAVSGHNVSDGVAMFAGGTVSNQASGAIASYIKGVVFYNLAGTVLNAGSIDGATFIGVALNAGGTINNAAGGTITGGYAGIYTGGYPSTISNAGSIAAGSNFAISTGVAIFAGGQISNAALGSISGVNKGIAFYDAAGTLTNAGSIGATGTSAQAVAFAYGVTNLLVDDPGAVFTGTVDGGNTIGSTLSSTLELASASSQGTINGLGSQFIDFAQITVDPGATWTFDGTNSLAAGVALTDFGTLLLNGTTLTDAGTATISGTGGYFAGATVSGAGALWNSSAQLVVGYLGNGSLFIGTQGSVAAAAQGSTAAAVLGVGVGSSGELLVDGTGSAFTAAGQLDVGQSGTGYLLIDNQGTAQTGGIAAEDPLQGFDVAQFLGGAGDAVVDGSQSLLSNTGRFVVGDAGFGTLLIEAGGTVITSPGTAVGLAGAVIGAQTGSDGSAVNVVGAGSGWNITGTLQVGDAAAGSLAINSGGAVTAGALDSAATTGGSGIISVVGTGSALTLSGQLTIGDGASAELSILNGATVGAGNTDIGLNAGGTGNVDIEGTGSELNIINSLNIGDAGVGVLTLGNNTELTVGNNINVGANGILNQLGGSIDPSTITIAPSGRQGGHGSTTASVEISNAGTLYASSGTETVNTPLITAPAGKSGILEIDTNGDLVLNVTSVDATQSVNFTDGTGILTLGTIGGFGGTIATVISGDEIILQGTSIAADSYNTTSDVLTLFNGTAGTIGALQLAASVDGFALLPNGSGGITVAPCFMAGTRISTERGEVAVEDLREGDRVQVVRIAGATPPPNLGPLRGPSPQGEGEYIHVRDSPSPCGRGAGGGVSAQPIIWIGHRTIDCARHPDPRKVWPVRIAAGAFGPNRPCRDLFLSPDHAVHLASVLIPIKHLINRTTIAQMPRDTVTYYHIELPEHSVLLAENLPAESYLDIGDRSQFANGGGAITLHPDFSARVWEARGCLPLIVTGPELDGVRRWINALAARQLASAATQRFRYASA